MNSSSLRRTALPAVALLTVGLTLTACGNNNSTPVTPVTPALAVPRLAIAVLAIIE